MLKNSLLVMQKFQTYSSYLISFFSIVVFLISCDLDEDPPFMDNTLYNDPQSAEAARDGIYSGFTHYNAMEQRMFVENGYSGLFTTRRGGNKLSSVWMNGVMKLNPNDNVATAFKNISKGETTQNIKAENNIPKGHKIALKKILKGEKIIKYDQIIGLARNDINIGEHVHVDNTEFKSTEHDYEFSTSVRLPNFVPENQRPTFDGFKRPNGQVGTRNYIGILTSVNCSATAARNIANAFDDKILSEYPNVDGVVSFTHGTGCGMADSGDGFEALQRVLLGYIQHPNLAGVLLIGLGCEANQIKFLLDAYNLNENPFFQTMTIQEMGGLRKTIEEGIKRIHAMLPEINQLQRSAQSVEHLSLALQCGGSDAWSGITSNPALGHAAVY